MKVRCVNNSYSALTKELQEFAFGQDESGKVDLTRGKEYVVYGVRENDLGKFYYILTDELNVALPWWMPSSYFKVVDEQRPTSWQKQEWRGYGEEIVYADPLYSEASEKIEDGTDEGLRAFEQMRKDAEKMH